MSTAKASASTLVASEPQLVYDFVSEATRATTFIPGLTKITNVSPAKVKVGQTWDYEFDWFGLIVSGNSRCTGNEPPRMYQFQTVTGNPSTWTYRFDPDDGGMRLTLEVEYNLPQNQLARFASQAVLEKQNSDRARQIVENIKALLEP